jgi:hypothetical protein
MLIWSQAQSIDLFYGESYSTGAALEAMVSLLERKARFTRIIIYPAREPHTPHTRTSVLGRH